MLTTRKKKNIVGEYQRHKSDTGSAEVQIALLNRKIEELATHLKNHSQDTHSRRGLLKMVSKRRKLLDYLSLTSPKSHSNLIKKLGLKK